MSVKIIKHVLNRCLSGKMIAIVIILIIIAGIWNQKHKIKENSLIADINDPFEVAHVDLKEILEKGQPVIINYGSDCSICKLINPNLMKIRDEMKNHYIIKYINIQKYPAEAKNLPVLMSPTQLLFDSAGKPYSPSDELKKEIHFEMYTDRKSNDHIYTTHYGVLTEDQIRIILEELKN